MSDFKVLFNLNWTQRPTSSEQKHCADELVLGEVLKLPITLK